MKQFLHIFNSSFLLPRKQTVFALNRIRMDITVFYLFIILAVASIPALIKQTFIDPITNVQIHGFFLFIYFFIIYYLILIIVVFCTISVIAYIAKWLAYLLKRKLHYAILWKMTAFATTIPTVLFTLLSIFFTLSNIFIVFAFIYVFVMLICIITIYPQRKPKTITR
ncbi:MAG TPA: DUF1189 family protein [Pseudogracilibacillus sp.]|nr:DUF1189 family protein [Pseudogracilibacillus sp.]